MTFPWEGRVDRSAEALKETESNLRGAWSYLRRRRELWKSIGSPSTLSIMDVGAGSGDVNQKAGAMVGSKGHQAEYYLGRYDKRSMR